MGSVLQDDKAAKHEEYNKKLKHRRTEGLIFIIVFIGLFGPVAWVMGVSHFLNTLMKTAHDLLMNTCFYLMGITVMAGALGKLLIEFGVIRLLETILAPLMRPFFGLPGVAALGGLMTFFSDNPAIISLANDNNFRSYFKKYELFSLTNFGTAFGMGLIVITFMVGKGFPAPAFMGLLGAIVGAVVSTRVMQWMIKPLFKNEPAAEKKDASEALSFESEGNVFLRALNAILDGGKSGVDLGLQIIPGVLIISTLVMVLTFGAKDPTIGYQGLAYEGVKFLPWLAAKFSGLFQFLFGFKNPELIAFPITSLGAVGAALSLIDKFIREGIVQGNDIAVFTAMGMCWSGYLSTHTAMLDALNYRSLTSKALLAHTIGGLCAGVAAHYLFVFFMGGF